MKVISTPNAPAAIGPYAQGYIANGMVFTSGQLPVDPAAGTMPEGIAAPGGAELQNVGAQCSRPGGTGLGSVIKTTCFLTDMNDFAAFNEVYARYFINCPARSCVAVKALPKNALCEIEAVAELTP